MIRLEIDYSRRNVGVEVYIWDKNENRFEQIDALFDTGAHTCAIDTDLLLRLGYDLDGAVKSYISTASSSRETAHRIRIEKMMLDKTPLESVLFNTFDFPLVSRPVILGMNIIRQFEVSMNFKSRLITMCENYLDEDDDYYDSDIFGDWRVDAGTV
jgi:hypothetical protein